MSSSGAFLRPPVPWPVADRRAAAAWLRLAAASAARIYLVALLVLGLSALVPSLGTWEALVVKSGSMEPAIDAGDVVLIAPGIGDDPVGRVVAYQHDGAEGRIIVHRVLALGDDGRYTTAGDANRQWDSAPVRADEILGRARLLVPFVGLPALWAQTHDFARLLLWLLVTAGAFRLLSRADPRARTGRPRIRALAAPIASIAVLALFLTSAAQLAASNFSADTRAAGNSWTSASRITQVYVSAVLGTSPWAYYLLDDTGTTAADASGYGRPAVFAGTVTRGQAGATSSSPGSSVLLGAGGRAVMAGNAAAGPTTYSLELWFRTSTTSGGKLIGFENSQSATSSKYDRHLFMRNDGRLSFGAWTASSQRILTTSSAYNNGLWHHVVVTSKPNGTYANTALYVDGSLVASGSTSVPMSYTGWWRAGSGTLASGSNYPSSIDFEGQLDHVAIYTSYLTAAQVSAHWAAR